MTYQTVAAISQILSLFMFLGMFLGVLVYALWPSNGEVFDKIQSDALGIEPSKRQTGNRGQS